MNMYKCNNCGNTDNFQEINMVRVFVQNGKLVDEKFVEREEVTCMDCGELFSEGMIEQIESELSQLATEIMTVISEYYAHGGDAEDVLSMIEQIISENE